MFKLKKVLAGFVAAISLFSAGSSVCAVEPGEQTFSVVSAKMKHYLIKQREGCSYLESLRAALNFPRFPEEVLEEGSIMTAASAITRDIDLHKRRIDVKTLIGSCEFWPRKIRKIFINRIVFSVTQVIAEKMGMSNMIHLINKMVPCAPCVNDDEIIVRCAKIECGVFYNDDNRDWLLKFAGDYGAKYQLLDDNNFQSALSIITMHEVTRQYVTVTCQMVYKFCLENNAAAEAPSAKRVRHA